MGICSVFHAAQKSSELIEFIQLHLQESKNKCALRMFSAGQGLTKVWMYVNKTCLRYLRGLPIIEEILSWQLSDDWDIFTFPGIIHMPANILIHIRFVSTSNYMPS